MRFPAVLIEAFAAAPCQGNGACVVRLDQPLRAAAMQAIAGSLRQSETAFVLRHGQRWLLRWFTPTCEVQLCGHATLASLLALAHWGELEPGASLVFHSRSGPLPVQLDPLQAGRGSIVLPSSDLIPAPLPEPLARLLSQRTGAAPLSFWTSALGYAVALLPPGRSLAGLDGLADQVSPEVRQGLVVMAAIAAAQVAPPMLDGTQADYQLRFFAPGLGISEDPVTGSAHALVAPYWLAQTGKTAVVGWQPSTRPGGMVCTCPSSGMIRLLGTGHLLWDGTLHYGHSEPGDSAVSAISDAAAWEALLPPG